MKKSIEQKRIDGLEKLINYHHTLLNYYEHSLEDIKSRPMSAEEYQNDGYCTCPICRSQDTFQVDMFTSGGDIAQVVKQCETCGTQWEERYNFADIHIYDDMDKKANQSQIITLVGSDGEIDVRADGTVVEVRSESNDSSNDLCYVNIVKVSFDTFRRVLNTDKLPKSMDILYVDIITKKGKKYPADIRCITHERTRKIN